MSPIVAHGDYCLLGRLPSGAYGERFLAKSIRSTADSSLLAYLRVEQDDGRVSSRTQTFIDTSKILLHRTHEHITEVTDCGEVLGEMFVVKQFLHGKSLDEVLDYGEQNGNSLDEQKTAKIGLSLADGLGFVHANDGCHGGLSLESILIGYNGEVKISDFGIGSDFFFADPKDPTEPWDEFVIRLSPEQLAGQDATPRSDIFVAGMILFELLTGRAPYQADSLEGTRNLLSEAKLIFPEKSTLPRDLATVVITCLAKDPNDRFADGYALLEALRRTIWGENISPQSSGLKDLMLSVFADDYSRECPHIEHYRQLDVAPLTKTEQKDDSPDSAELPTMIQNISLIRSRLGQDLNAPPASPELTDEFEIDTDDFEEETQNRAAVETKPLSSDGGSNNPKVEAFTEKTDITPLNPPPTQPKNSSLSDLTQDIDGAHSVALEADVGDLPRPEQVQQQHQSAQGNHKAPVGEHSFVAGKPLLAHPKTALNHKKPGLTSIETGILWTAFAVGSGIVYYTYAYIHTTQALQELVSQLLAWSSNRSSS